MDCACNCGGDTCPRAEAAEKRAKTQDRAAAPRQRRAKNVEETK